MPTSEAAPAWVPYAKLIPVDQLAVAQSCTPVPGSDEQQLVMTEALMQADKTENGTITLYERDGAGWRVVGSMFTVAGGHLFDVVLEVDGGGQLYVSVRWPQPTATRDSTWVRLPWLRDKVWRKDEALTFAVPWISPVRWPGDPWLQGRCAYDGWTFVAYGSPWIPGGPRADAVPGVHGHIIVTDPTGQVGRIECGELGRVGTVMSGAPIDGMLELEGVSILAKADGSVHLLLGVTTGGRGKRTHWLWTRQIKAAPVPVPEQPETPAEPEIPPTPEVPMTMRVSARQAWPAFCTQWEGRLSWLYLDTKNLPTTGLGYRVVSVAAMLALPWLTKNNTPATDEQKRAEWDRICARTDLSDNSGWAYQSVATLHLPQSEIDRQLMAKTAEMWTRLGQTIPDLAKWPADAQLVIMDMAWQNGAAFLDLKKDGKYVWANMRPAVLAQDWLRAADAVPDNRPDAGDDDQGDRAEARQRLFRNAARVKFAGLPGTNLWNTREVVVQIGGAARGTLLEVSAGKVAWAFSNSTTVGTNAFYAQRMLDIVGRYDGPLDGLAGSMTKTAWNGYAKSVGVAASDELAVLKKLSAATFKMPVVA